MGYLRFSPGCACPVVGHAVPLGRGFLGNKTIQVISMDMDKESKELRQITKEIVVKFIEMGKVTPTSFPQLFPVIYNVIVNTLDHKNTDASGDGSRENQ